MISTAFAAVLQLPGRAQAGPVEQLVQVALNPSDPNVVVLRYMYGGDGLLYSDDGGMSFKLQCLSAVDPALRKIGTIAVAGDGHLVMGLYEGLLQDQGGGCGFSAEPTLDGVWISDLAVDPIDPQVLYASTSKSGMGGTAEFNGVYRRDASGAFAQFGTLEELLITRMRVTATDSGLRIYQSAIHGNAPGTINGMEVADLPNYVIRVSDDGAETFTEFPYGSGDGSAFRLVGVDPSEPDRIVGVLDHTQEADELFVSTDRGETFTPYHTVSQLGAIEILPDGRVFIGEAGVSTDPTASTGLWSAASLAEPPAKLADDPVQCLAYQAATDTLFACQRWMFGTVDPSDGTFSERVSFKTVEDFVSCDGVDTAAMCKMQLCRDYCGLGHFASAPVCSEYEDQYCGHCAALIEASMEDPQCGVAPSAGAGGSSGAAATPDGGAQAGSGVAGTSEPRPAGGQGGNAGEAGAAGGGDNDDGDGGGCSCATPGHRARSASWWSVGLLLAWALIARRRRTRG